MMEDKEIVDLYWARSENAIRETAKKYGRYCHYIAYQILSNDSDAEEVVNDTYLKAWKTIPPNMPDSLKAYVGMICRQISLDRSEAQKAKKRNRPYELVLDELAECIPSSDGSRDPGESFALREALNQFIWSLPDQTQNIFVRRYWYSSPVSEIAEEYGMTENHVSVLLFNTRKKLKKFLSREGFDL